MKKRKKLTCFLYAYLFCAKIKHIKSTLYRTPGCSLSSTERSPWPWHSASLERCTVWTWEWRPAEKEITRYKEKIISGHSRWQETPYTWAAENKLQFKMLCHDFTKDFLFYWWILIIRLNLVSIFTLCSSFSSAPVVNDSGWVLPCTLSVSVGGIYFVDVCFFTWHLANRALILPVCTMNVI